MADYCYHTHTSFSDGTGNLDDMLCRAVELGWKEIGLSDHLIVHRGFPNSPSLPIFKSSTASFMYRSSFAEAEEFFKRYLDTICEARNRYPIKIFAGAEVDFYTYPGWLDGFEHFREVCPLDYYLSGNHFLILPDGNIIDPEDIRFAGTKEVARKIIAEHYETVASAAASGLFDFMAHIDYMRRVKFDDDFHDEKQNLINVLAENRMPIELSTKGLRKFGKFYPEPWLMQAMREQDIPVIISDDAHSVEELGYEFEKAEQYLEAMDYTNRWKLS